MCTVVVSVSPGAEVPVLLAGIRDEFLGRPWRPPEAHWADRPHLLGGLDLHAGGSWLAVDVRATTVVAVLNGRGRAAPSDRRRTRGELPLRAADLGELDLAEQHLAAFDPFHLLLAQPAGVRLWSWDGDRVSYRAIESGVHLVTSAGLDAADVQPRVAHFLPRFAARTRPAPSAGTPSEPWGEWLALVDGDGLDPGDDRAIVVRHNVGDRVWGSTSASLVALRRAGGLRYDFSARPGDPAAWDTVLDSPSSGCGAGAPYPTSEGRR